MISLAAVIGAVPLMTRFDAGGIIWIWRVLKLSGRVLLLLASVFAFASCADSDTTRPPPVPTMSVSVVRGDPTALKVDVYLSSFHDGSPDNVALMLCESVGAQAIAETRAKALTIAASSEILNESHIESRGGNIQLWELSLRDGSALPVEVTIGEDINGPCISAVDGNATDLELVGIVTSPS